MPASLLQPQQHAFVTSVLPGYRIVRDLSWGITDTVVLLVEHGGQQRIVKAFGVDNHHFEREYAALTAHVAPLMDYAGQLIASCTDARTFVLTVVPGNLVMNTAAEYRPAVHEKAGALLRKFHNQATQASAQFERSELAAAFRWLHAEHRIPSATAAAVAAYLEAYEPTDGNAVPTHGDYQPRNWLIDDDGVVRAIDFGRFAWRPPESDFTFLHTRQWNACKECEAAFFRGYGTDPRTEYPERWKMYQTRFAVGAAAWGFKFGQTTLENEGLEILERMFPAALRS